MRFVKQLFEIFTDESAHKKKNFLRNKNPTDPSMTDVELFKNMALGDTWDDASVASVYFYLRRSRHLMIPPCWQSTIDEFDRELHNKVPRFGCNVNLLAV